MSKIIACLGCIVSVILAFAPQVFAGEPVTGIEIYEDTISAYSSSTYTIAAAGWQTTAIGIQGDGDTDLDLYVFDRYGNLLARGESNSDFEALAVTLTSPELLTVKVVNRGRVYNRFRIAVTQE